MKPFVLAVTILLTTGTVFAKDCSQTAYKAARAVDSISNGTRISAYALQSVRVTKSVRSGGETLDTLEVSMVVSEDMAAIWKVDLYSGDCVIKSVSFVSGD